MAFNANVVVEVRASGSDTNGGGFRTGATGTDWSLQDTAQYSVTDGVTAGTATITSASANFGTDVVGNLMYVQGGTGSVVAGWYEIISRTNSTTIGVDRSTGLTAGTGVTLKIGGALASPGQASGLPLVGGNIIYIKYDASPYVITSATTNISGGCILGATNVHYIGYDTARAQYQIFTNRPTLQLNAGVSTAIILAGTNAASWVQGLIFDGNSQTSSSGVLNSGELFYCKAINCTQRGLAANTLLGTKAVFCEVANCTFSGSTTGISFGTSLYSVGHDCTTSGANFSVFSGSQVCIGCVAYNISVGDGFGQAGHQINCVAYNCVNGFNAQNGSISCVNCIAENNSGIGFRNNAGAATLFNCASYNNTSGRTNGSGVHWVDNGAILGSSSFFNNAASFDFTLNNTAGAGALCRALGYPTTSFEKIGLASNTLSFLDVGAFQHQEGTGVPASGLTNIKALLFYPDIVRAQAGNWGVNSSNACTAAGHYQAIVLCAQEDMTINYVGWKPGTATGNPVVDVRIETVDVTTGLPNGLWATNTNVNTSALTTVNWVQVQLTAPAVIPKGSVYCVKFAYVSGTSFGTQTWGIPQPTSQFPYFIDNRASTTKAAANAGWCMSLGDTATTFYQVQCTGPVTVAAAVNFNNSVAGAKRGVRVVLPFACRIVGIKRVARGNNGSFNYMVLDDAGNELGNSSTLSSQNSFSGGSGLIIQYFDNPVTVAPGTPVRVVLEPTTTTGVDMDTLTIQSSTYLPAMPGGTNLSGTTYTTAGGWVDSQSVLHLVDLIIDQVPNGYVTGFGQIKQFNRGTPY